MPLLTACSRGCPELYCVCSFSVEAHFLSTCFQNTLQITCCLLCIAKLLVRNTNLSTQTASISRLLSTGCRLLMSHIVTQRITYQKIVVQDVPENDDNDMLKCCLVCERHVNSRESVESSANVIEVMIL